MKVKLSFCQRQSHKIGLVAGMHIDNRQAETQVVAAKTKLKEVAMVMGGSTASFRLKQKMDIGCLIHNCLTPDIERVPTPRYKKR